MAHKHELHKLTMNRPAAAVLVVVAAAATVVVIEVVVVIVAVVVVVILHQSPIRHLYRYAIALVSGHFLFTRL